MAMICKDGSMWEPSDEQLDRWISAFPNIDVHQELLVAATWLADNPARRKTERGMSRFCGTWLTRASKNGGSPFYLQKQADKQSKSMNTREMSSLDDLSHNFLGCPVIRAHFIEKFGQSFENGERLTSND